MERILAANDAEIQGVIGNRGFLKGLRAEEFTDEQFGLPTVRDILGELEKPGRDPRPEFKTAAFQEGVEQLSDLKAGMILEGVVTNVTNFGAFVDVGVHQDGLVHISALSDKFVKDPREVVKAGDVVKVKVMEVDLKRKRVGLSMRLSDDVREQSARPAKREPSRPRKAKQGSQGQPMQGAMAAAFAQLKSK